MGAKYDAVVVDIGDQISALSPSKAGELLAYLKDIYNIEPIFGPPQLWSVIFTGYDTNNRIALVEAVVGAATDTPLIIKEGMSKVDADKLKTQLKAVKGFSINLRMVCLVQPR